MPFDQITNPFENPADAPPEYRAHARLQKTVSAGWHIHSSKVQCAGGLRRQMTPEEKILWQALRVQNQDIRRNLPGILEHLLAACQSSTQEAE